MESDVFLLPRPWIQQELKLYSSMDFEFSLGSFFCRIIKRQSKYDVLFSPGDVTDEVVKSFYSFACSRCGYSPDVEYSAVHQSFYVSFIDFAKAVLFYEGFVFSMCANFFRAAYVLEF